MFIGISCRVDEGNPYKERRDCIDQRWAKFLANFPNLVPILIPNNIDVVERMLREIEFTGLILTGGNDLVKYDGDAHERDAVEHMLLEYSKRDHVSLLGVCRGMQLMLDYEGVLLHQVSGHAGTNIDIEFQQKPYVVNSYHNWGSLEEGDSYQLLAKSSDGVVKAIKHVRYPWWGIMWHPERNESVAELDKKIMGNIFHS